VSSERRSSCFGSCAGEALDAVSRERQVPAHELEFDFKYDGLGMGTLAFDNVSGIGRGGTGTLKVDGKVVAEQKMEQSLPTTLAWDENLDVGSDTGTPVDDNDYKVPFAFTGKISKITLTIDRPKLTPEDEKKLGASEARQE